MSSLSTGYMLRRLVLEDSQTLLSLEHALLLLLSVTYFGNCQRARLLVFAPSIFIFIKIVCMNGLKILCTVND